MLFATEPRPSSPIATAAVTPKVVRLSEEPTASRKFGPKDCPSQVNAEHTGDWSPLAPKDDRPWRPYDGSFVARGARLLFQSVPGVDKAWTLRSGFLTRFKSVQSYAQCRKAEANAQRLEPSDCQVSYGTIDYRIDLLATKTVKARQVGIFQDPRHMGMKIPTNDDITATILGLTFGPFEKVEDVSSWSARVPNSIAPASAKPPRWPKTLSVTLLENWVKKTWPRKSGN